MAASKRSLPPDDEAITVHTAPGVSAERAVSDWRSARGLRQAALSPPGAFPSRLGRSRVDVLGQTVRVCAGSRHQCTSKVAFSRVGAHHFLCNRCGWMHVCDANCSERVLQRGADLPACPISGYTFDMVMNEWEVCALLAVPLHAACYGVGRVQARVCRRSPVASGTRTSRMQMMPMLARGGWELPGAADTTVALWQSCTD